MHYSIFWNFEAISQVFEFGFTLIVSHLYFEHIASVVLQELVINGALVNLENNYGESPLDRARGPLFEILSRMFALKKFFPSKFID